MNLHECFDSGTIDRPNVLHSIPFEPVLDVDLVNDFKQELLHHEWGRLCKLDPMVEVHSLRWLRVPDFLRDQLAQATVYLNVRELQLLVDSIDILAIQDHKDVSLRESSLLELVLETLISGSKRTHWPLFLLERRQPLHLLLLFNFFFGFEALASLLRQHVFVRDAFLFDRHRY